MVGNIYNLCINIISILPVARKLPEDPEDLQLPEVPPPETINYIVHKILCLGILYLNVRVLTTELTLSPGAPGSPVRPRSPRSPRGPCKI